MLDDFFTARPRCRSAPKKAKEVLVLLLFCSFFKVLGFAVLLLDFDMITSYILKIVCLILKFSKNGTNHVPNLLGKFVKNGSNFFKIGTFYLLYIRFFHSF